MRDREQSRDVWGSGALGVLEAVFALDAVVLLVRANLRFMFPRPAMLQHWDEGYAIAFARRMLDGQNLPYVDGVSQRGPLFYWLMALGVKIFGVGTWMPARALMLVFMPLTALLGFLAACFAGRTLAGAVMALVYFTLCARTYGEGAAGYGLACNSEHFANMFSMAALLALTISLRGRNMRRAPLAGLAVAGGLLMLSGLCKQVGLVVAAPMGLWVLAEAVDRPDLSVAERRWMPVAFAAGFLAPFVVLVLRYAVAGELWALYYYPFAYNYAIYVPAIRGAAKAKFWHALLLSVPESLSVLIGLGGCGAALVFSRLRLSADAGWSRELARRYAAAGFDIVAGSSVVLTLYTASMAMRVWGHYYTQVFPWAALAGGVLLDRASGLGPLVREPRRSLMVRAAILVPLAVMTHVSWALKSREYDLSRELDDAVATDAWPVCRFIAENTKPSDSIFIWGFSPAPYVACNRRAASRYVFTIYPVGVVPWIETPREVEESRVVPGSRELLLSDLRKDMPAAIFDFKESLLGRSMMDYDFLRTFVTENYCEVDDAALGLNAWLRKPAGGCASGARTSTEPETRPLVLYWSPRSPPVAGDLEARAPHRDSLTVATAEGVRDAERQSYEREPAGGDDPGTVFTRQRPGTVPLRVYYDERHRDSVTTTKGVDGFDGAYEPVRVEGYIYADKQPDTKPLMLYYDVRSHDYFTTALTELATSMEEAGYVWVRVEGYVPRH